MHEPQWATSSTHTYTRTHARTHAHAHACTHTCTHAHTHTHILTLCHRFSFCGPLVVHEHGVESAVHCRPTSPAWLILSWCVSLSTNTTTAESPAVEEYLTPHAESMVMVSMCSMCVCAQASTVSFMSSSAMSCQLSTLKSTTDCPETTYHSICLVRVFM